MDALERALTVRPTEIWYDEFSGQPPGVHRFLLISPGEMDDRGEVHIEFADFDYAEVHADGRTLPP